MSLGTAFKIKKASFQDVIEDLVVRFIINCPAQDLESSEIEEAHWFYLDFVRVENPALPSMKLKTFVETLFLSCPLLRRFSADMTSDLLKFYEYKTSVPVRGVIILNKKMTKVLVVKGWQSGSPWGFPKGKIAKDEDDAACAVRETFEEIGYDITPYIDRNEYVEIVYRKKSVRLYIVRGVPTTTAFCPQTRKEISKIEWHDVKELPAYSMEVASKKYFLVAPFMKGLAKYIARHRGLPSSFNDKESSMLKSLLGVSNNTDQAYSISQVADMFKSPSELGPQDEDSQNLLNSLKTGIDRTTITTTSTKSITTQESKENNVKELLELLNLDMGASLIQRTLSTNLNTAESSVDNTMMADNSSYDILPSDTGRPSHSELLQSSPATISHQPLSADAAYNRHHNPFEYSAPAKPPPPPNTLLASLLNKRISGPSKRTRTQSTESIKEKKSSTCTVDLLSLLDGSPKPPSHPRTPVPRSSRPESTSEDRQASNLLRMLHEESTEKVVEGSPEIESDHTESTGGEPQNLFDRLIESLDKTDIKQEGARVSTPSIEATQTSFSVIDSTQSFDKTSNHEGCAGDESLSLLKLLKGSEQTNQEVKEIAGVDSNDVTSLSKEVNSVRRSANKKSGKKQTHTDAAGDRKSGVFGSANDKTIRNRPELMRFLADFNRGKFDVM